MPTEKTFDLFCAEVDDGIAHFGWSEKEPGPGDPDYLLLTIDLYEEDDEYMKIHLEYNDQSSGVYGGLQKVTLSESSAEFILTKHTASMLGVDCTFRVLFDNCRCDKDSVDLLRQMIEASQEEVELVIVY